MPQPDECLAFVLGANPDEGRTQLSLDCFVASLPRNDGGELDETSRTLIEHLSDVLDVDAFPGDARQNEPRQLFNRDAANIELEQDSGHAPAIAFGQEGALPTFSPPQSNTAAI